MEKGKLEKIFSGAEKVDAYPMISVIVTPKMAKEMLDTMENNRTLKPSVVARYARDMREKRWKYSPNPISFDENGHLIDGQHRLNAIVNSGLQEPFVIAFEVKRDTPIDIQKQRNTADNLVYSGVIPKEIGTGKNFAIANSMIRVRSGGSAFNTFSDYDKGHVLMKYSEAISNAYYLSGLGKESRVMRKSIVQASLASALISGYDPNVMENFCRSANTGLPVGANPTPALVVSRMIKDLVLTRRELSSIVEQALLDCAAGKKRQKNYNVEGDLPFTNLITLNDLLS